MNKFRALGAACATAAAITIIGAGVASATAPVTAIPVKAPVSTGSASGSASPAKAPVDTGSATGSANLLTGLAKLLSTGSATK